jgi:hypothetical protein
MHNIPRVIDNEFLSEIECIDIENRIHYLRNHWQERSNISCFYFLPLGMYTCNKEEYTEDVSKFRLLMYENFNDIYAKLINKLQKELTVEILTCNTVHLPGFHISSATGMSKTNFHRDRFKHLSQRIPRGGLSYKDRLMKPKILSIIVPISLSNSNDGLLYYDNETLKEIIYTNGMLAVWPGSVMHSIKPFTIQDQTKFRITMQSHLIQFENQAYLFW